MKKSQNIGKLTPAFAVLLFLIFWECLCRILKLQNYVLPAPSRIFTVLWEKRVLLTMHTSYTLYEAVIGLFLSCVFGVLAALVMYRFRMVERALSPLIVISQTVPIIALAPLVMVWFGIGIGPKIGIVVLVCFFPIAVSTLSGFKSTDPAMIHLLRTMGAKSGRIFIDVSLPSAAPQIFTGVRMAATYSVMGAVIGEWLGAKSGLGIFMTRAISSHRADMLFASVFIVVLISLILYGITVTMEQIFLPWKKIKSSI
ncbi:MAG: ABC transporter permease [Clostridiales bacterium]|nr:ABC transporter permease [Clostridiales bacterium]